MANIRIPETSGTISITKGTGKKITLSTKDKYVAENIDVHVQPVQGTFAVAPTSGKTYTDEMSSNTVIATSGTGSGYLYLNAGWFNDTKISLGHLIPGEAADNEVPTSLDLRVGYTAYDENGGRVQGAMPDVTPQGSGGTMSVSVSTYSYSAPSVSVGITGKFAPATDGNGNALVSGGLGQTYGVQTTAISGTEGTDFLSIDATRTASNGEVYGRATYSRSAVTYSSDYVGYLNVASGTTISGQGAISQTSENSSKLTIIPDGSDGFPALYIPIVKTVSGTGGGVTQGTSSATATVSTVNVTSTTNVTYPSGQSATTYGVVTTAPSGSYVTVGSTAGGTASASGTASIAYTRAAVSSTQDWIGAISKAAGTNLLDAASDTFTTSISGTSAAISKSGTNYYIPVVTPAGSGGAVSKTSGSGSVTGTKPNVAIASSASSSASTYGLTTTAPSAGRENTDWLKVTTTGTIGTAQTWSGTASIVTTRAAVKYNAAYKGLISKGTSDVFFASSTNAGTVTHDISGSVQSTINSGTSNYTSNYYVKISEPIVEGGDLNMPATVSMSGTNSLTVGTKVSLNKGASSTGGWTGSVAPATYGLTDTEPSSGRQNYVRFLPGQNGNNASTTITGSISASVTAVIMNKDAGVSHAYSNEVMIPASTEQSASGSRSVTASASNGTAYYVPIVSISGTLTPTNTITKPSYSSDSSGAFHSAINGSTSVPGYLTTAPSSGNYITITPSVSYIPGSVTSNVAAVRIAAGLTAGGTLAAGSDTDSITATTGAATAKFIAVYDGTYSLTDL